MLGRTRSKNVTPTRFGIKPPGGSFSFSDGEVARESLWESSWPGSCNCVHNKVETTINATATTKYGTTYVWSGFPGQNPPIPSPPGLNWGKLPTSSEFSIIQFFAELDDTIGLFTQKFWKELSYGSFTWGVMPFVNDVKAILETIKNLSVDVSKFSYEDQYKGDLPFDYVDRDGNRWNGTLFYKWRYTGSADMSFQHGAAQWLDRLGFHPDLATAWDLVPLSFVVNWLLPVGQFLESYRSGGWCKVIYFDGWLTCKWSVEGTWTPPSGDLPAPISAGYKNSGFTRTHVSQPLFITPDPEKSLGFTEPTVTQVFNMAYIAGAFKKIPVLNRTLLR